MSVESPNIPGITVKSRFRGGRWCQYYRVRNCTAGRIKDALFCVQTLGAQEALRRAITLPRTA